MLVSNASIFAPNARLFGTTSGLSNLSTILYGRAADEAQEPSLADVPSISIGNVSLLGEGGWKFRV
jgi:hypothetical protein